MAHVDAVFDKVDALLQQAVDAAGAAALASELDDDVAARVAQVLQRDLADQIDGQSTEQPTWAEPPMPRVDSRARSNFVEVASLPAEPSDPVQAPVVVREESSPEQAPAVTEEPVLAGDGAEDSVPDDGAKGIAIGITTSEGVESASAAEREGIKGSTADEREGIRGSTADESEAKPSSERPPCNPASWADWVETLTCGLRSDR